MRRRGFLLSLLLLGVAAHASAAQAPAKPAGRSDVDALVKALQKREPALSATSGMRHSFAALAAERSLPSEAYDDFVLVRLLFEATRDAGFWGIGWTITDREPVSDAVWQQWQSFQGFAPARPTAYAECDEISALFAFLGRALGVRHLGLFWPARNHTVAVWEIPRKPAPVRLVIPTTQIFLEYADMLGTKRFDPWQQKVIYEYSRRDVPGTRTLPQPLFAFFLRQVDRYAGASDATLQNLRYLRASVFLKQRAPQEARSLALSTAPRLKEPEDIRAIQYFVEEMDAATKPLT